MRERHMDSRIVLCPEVTLLKCTHETLGGTWIRVRVCERGEATWVDIDNPTAALLALYAGVLATNHPAPLLDYLAEFHGDTLIDRAIRLWDTHTSHAVQAAGEDRPWML